MHNDIEDAWPGIDATVTTHPKPVPGRYVYPKAGKSFGPSYPNPYLALHYNQVSGPDPNIGFNSHFSPNPDPISDSVPVCVSRPKPRSLS